MKTRSLIVMMMLALLMTVGVAEAAATKPVRGSITKIDGKDITVKPKKGDETTVTATDTTEVTINGEKKTLADLSVGQKMVSVKLDTDGKTALSITVGKAAATTAPSAPTTAPAGN